MIVMALMGLLATLAASGYSGFVQEARRADATSVMHEVRHALEQHYSRRYNYADAQSGVDFPSKSPRDGSDEFYTIAVDVYNDGQDFLIRAVAQGKQAEDKCGNLSLSRVGEFKNSGGAEPGDCFE